VPEAIFLQTTAGSIKQKKKQDALVFIVFTPEALLFTSALEGHIAKENVNPDHSKEPSPLTEKESSLC
jgi:hypothetical protein